MSSYSADWRRGVFERPGAPGGPSAVALFGGDLAPGARQWQRLRTDPDGFWGEFLSRWKSADLRVLNLEGVFSDADYRLPKDGPHLVWPVADWALIEKLPVDVYCMANNHVMDGGVDGLRCTRDLVRGSGKRACGAGVGEEDRASLVIPVNGLSVAILNAAEAEEAARDAAGVGAAPMEMDTVCAEIKRLRGDGHVVIIVAHAGREYIPCPPPYIRAWYRAMIDAGAHLVVGHHPHVPQGVECYRHGLILYSLGNLVLNCRASGHQNEGVTAEAVLDASGVVRLTLHFHEIDPDGVRELRGDRRDEMLQLMATLSDFCSDDVAAGRLWDACADRWLAGQASREVAGSAALLSSEQDLMWTLLRMLEERSGRSWWYRIGSRWMPYLVRIMAGRQANRAGTMSSPLFQRGAVRTRNRFATPAHRELYLHALERATRPLTREADNRATTFLDEWFAYHRPA